VLHCSRCMWIVESNPLLKKTLPKIFLIFFSRVFFYLFCVILVCIFIP
jgi:hypothetical protein